MPWHQDVDGYWPQIRIGLSPLPTSIVQRTCYAITTSATTAATYAYSFHVSFYHFSDYLYRFLLIVVYFLHTHYSVIWALISVTGSRMILHIEALKRPLLIMQARQHVETLTLSPVRRNILVELEVMNDRANISTDASHFACGWREQGEGGDG